MISAGLIMGGIDGGGSGTKLLKDPNEGLYNPEIPMYSAPISPQTTFEAASALANSHIMSMELSEESFLGGLFGTDYSEVKTSLSTALNSWVVRLNSEQFDSSADIIRDIWETDSEARPGIAMLAGVFDAHKNPSTISINLEQLLKDGKLGSHLTIRDLIAQEENPSAQTLLNEFSFTIANTGDEGKSECASVANAYGKLPMYYDEMKQFMEDEFEDRSYFAVLRDALKGFTDPENMITILGGYGLARLTTTAIFARLLPEGISTLAFLGKAAAHTGRVITEAGAFTVYGRGITAAISTKPVDWSALSISKDWASLTLGLGAIGLVGRAMLPMRRSMWGNELYSNYSSNHVATLNGNIVPELNAAGKIIFGGANSFTQATAFYTAAEFSQAVGLSDHEPTFFEEWAMLTQFQMAVGMANMATGNSIARAEFKLQSRPAIRAIEKIADTLIADPEIRKDFVKDTNDQLALGKISIYHLSRLKDVLATEDIYLLDSIIAINEALGDSKLAWAWDGKNFSASSNPRGSASFFRSLSDYVKENHLPDDIRVTLINDAMDYFTSKRIKSDLITESQKADLMNIHFLCDMAIHKDYSSDLKNHAAKLFGLSLKKLDPGMLNKTSKLLTKMDYDNDPLDIVRLNEEAIKALSDFPNYRTNIAYEHAYNALSNDSRPDIIRGIINIATAPRESNIPARLSSDIASSQDGGRTFGRLAAFQKHMKGLTKDQRRSFRQNRIPALLYYYSKRDVSTVARKPEKLSSFLSTLSLAPLPGNNGRLFEFYKDAFEKDLLHGDRHAIEFSKVWSTWSTGQGSYYLTKYLSRINLQAFTNEGDIKSLHSLMYLLGDYNSHTRDSFLISQGNRFKINNVADVERIKSGLLYIIANGSKPETKITDISPPRLNERWIEKHLEYLDEVFGRGEFGNKSFLKASKGEIVDFFSSYLTPHFTKPMLVRQIFGWSQSILFESTIGDVPKIMHDVIRILDNPNGDIRSSGDGKWGILIDSAKRLDSNERSLIKQHLPEFFGLFLRKTHTKAMDPNRSNVDAALKTLASCPVDSSALSTISFYQRMLKSPNNLPAEEVLTVINRALKHQQIFDAINSFDLQNTSTDYTSSVHQYALFLAGVESSARQGLMDRMPKEITDPRVALEALYSDLGSQISEKLSRSTSDAQSGDIQSIDISLIKIPTTTKKFKNYTEAHMRILSDLDVYYLPSDYTKTLKYMVGIIPHMTGRALYVEAQNMITEIFRTTKSEELKSSLDNIVDIINTNGDASQKLVEGSPHHILALSVQHMPEIMRVQLAKDLPVMLDMRARVYLNDYFTKAQESSIPFIKNLLELPLSKEMKEGLEAYDRAFSLKSFDDRDRTRQFFVVMKKSLSNDNMKLWLGRVANKDLWSKRTARYAHRFLSLLAHAKIEILNGFTDKAGDTSKVESREDIQRLTSEFRRYMSDWFVDNIWQNADGSKNIKLVKESIARGDSIWTKYDIFERLSTYVSFATKQGKSAVRRFASELAKPHQRVASLKREGFSETEIRSWEALHVKNFDPSGDGKADGELRSFQQTFSRQINTHLWNLEQSPKKVTLELRNECLDFIRSINELTSKLDEGTATLMDIGKTVDLGLENPKSYSEYFGKANYKEIISDLKQLSQQMRSNKKIVSKLPNEFVISSNPVDIALVGMFPYKTCQRVSSTSGYNDNGQPFNRAIRGAFKVAQIRQSEKVHVRRIIEVRKDLKGNTHLLLHPSYESADFTGQTTFNKSVRDYARDVLGIPEKNIHTVRGGSNYPKRPARKYPLYYDAF